MHVVMRTAMAGASYAYRPGQLVEVSDEVGKAWIKAGIAAAPQEPKETTALYGAPEQAVSPKAKARKKAAKKR